METAWMSRAYALTLPINAARIIPSVRINRDLGYGKIALIEVVDGRWGASLWIGPEAEDEYHLGAPGRPMPLLLFDLWNDPWCLSPVNEQHPELVEHYTAFLEAQWEAHQALGQRFTPGGEVALTPEQLETLRALGYIQ